MDYKKLAADLLSGCPENCADCEYAGDSEFECTIAQLAATAITDLLARAEEAEARAEKVERERDAAVSDLTFAVNKYRLFTTDINLCYLCKFNFPSSGENEQTYECPGCYGDDCFEWRGQKNEE